MKRGGGIDVSDGGDEVSPQQQATTGGQPVPSTVDGKKGKGDDERNFINKKTKKEDEKQAVLRLAPDIEPNEESKEGTKKQVNEQKYQGKISKAEKNSSPTSAGNAAGTNTTSAATTDSSGMQSHQRPHRGPRLLQPDDCADAASESSDEDEETRPGAEYVAGTNISSSSPSNIQARREEGPNDVEEGYNGMDSLSGNTLIIEAQRVADDTPQYEELRQELEEIKQQQRQGVVATIMPDGAGDGNGKDSTDVSTSNRRSLYIILAGIGIISALVVVLVIVLLGDNGNNNGNSSPGEAPTPPPTATLVPSASPTKMPTTVPTRPPTAMPTRTPSTHPTMQPTTTLQILADIVGVEDLDSLSETSPELEALNWMSYQDPISTELLSSAMTSGGSDTRTLSERYIITILYFAMNGPSWLRQERYLSTLSVCDWNNGISFGDPWGRGIYCNGQGEITTIAITSNGLEGTIPTQLGDLDSLTLLWLYQNNVGGTIPDTLASLTRLTELSLHTNQFVGTIPNSLSALTQLISLSVNINLLTGTIPESFITLTQLTSMDLHINQLTGNVPTTFGSSLTALRQFNVYENNLTGNLDPIFCPSATTTTTTTLTTLEADCSGPNPEIICSCCTECH